MTDDTNKITASQTKRKRTPDSGTKRNASVVKETRVKAYSSNPHRAKKDDQKVDPKTLVSAKLSAKQEARLESIKATLETLPPNVDDEAKEFAALEAEWAKAAGVLKTLQAQPAPELTWF